MHFSEEELLASLERRRAAKGWKRRAWAPGNAGELPALGTVVDGKAVAGDATFVSGSSAKNQTFIDHGTPAVAEGAEAAHEKGGHGDGHDGDDTGDEAGEAGEAPAPAARRRWGRQKQDKGKRISLVPVGTGAIDPSAPTVGEDEEEEDAGHVSFAPRAGVLAEDEIDEEEEEEKEEEEAQDYVDMLASMKAVLTSRPKAAAAHGDGHAKARSAGDGDGDGGDREHGAGDASARDGGDDDGEDDDSDDDSFFEEEVSNTDDEDEAAEADVEGDKRATSAAQETGGGDEDGDGGDEDGGDDGLEDIVEIAESVRTMLAASGSPLKTSPGPEATASASSGLSVFLQLEQTRAEMERRLGEDIFLQGYQLLQEMQRVEEDEASMLHQQIEELLGEANRDCYQKMLHLVVQDGAHFDNTGHAGMVAARLGDCFFFPGLDVLSMWTAPHRLFFLLLFFSFFPIVSPSLSHPPPTFLRRF